MSPEELNASAPTSTGATPPPPPPQVPTPPSASNAAPADETPAPAPQKPRKSRTGMWIALTLMALLAIGVLVAGYIYMQQKSEAAEDRAYAALDLSNSSDDFQEFLQLYPNSERRADVEKRMRELQNMERDWARVQQTDSRDAIVDFKNKYLNPYYDKLCNARLDSLDWVDAQAMDSPEGPRLYMAQHPDGRFYDDAAALLTSMNERAAKQDSLDAVALAEQLAREDSIATSSDYSIYGDTVFDGLSDNAKKYIKKHL